MTPMRFRAEITVNFEAEDFQSAGAHQKALTEAFEEIRARYAEASLSLHQRRFRTRAPTSALRQGGAPRVAVAPYED